jgi:hypothetical protein
MGGKEGGGRRREAGGGAERKRGMEWERQRQTEAAGPRGAVSRLDSDGIGACGRLGIVHNMGPVTRAVQAPANRETRTKPETPPPPTASDSHSIPLRQLRLPASARGVGFQVRLVRDYHGPDREASPLTMPPAASHIRLRSIRCACRRRPRDPTGFYGAPAGRGSHATTCLGTAGRGTTRVPLAAGGPMELLVDALLPGRIRPY